MVVKKIVNEKNEITVDIFNADGSWVYHQPMNPLTGEKMLTEKEADEVANLLIKGFQVAHPPSYEELQERLELVETELLLIQGVI